MMKQGCQKPNNFYRFYGRKQAVLALWGIIPFLLIIYLFVYEKIKLIDAVTLFSALAVFSIMIGLSFFRRSADKFVSESTGPEIMEAEEKGEPMRIQVDRELSDIAGNIDSVLRKVNEANRDMKEQTVQLMIYARDLSLSHRRMKEEQELRYRLSRYVGENLVEKLINSKDSLFLENERKQLTILFADIRSFCTMAERMSAEDVVSMLNEFFGIMVDIIFRNNGILDKFVGDQLMALFGLIPSENSAPHDAIKAAIEMQDATEDLMKQRAKQDKETFEIGIGINTGSAIVGNVGPENRMDYTVIGDSVNVAARLEQIASEGQIIIGEQTYRQTQGLFHMRKREEIYAKNKTEPVICYEVVR